MHTNSIRRNKGEIINFPLLPKISGLLIYDFLAMPLNPDALKPP